MPDALRKAGANVEVHGAHFPPNAPDTDILRFIGARGWAFLSKDENVRRRPAERRALVEAGVAAFILTAGRAKGEVTRRRSWRPSGGCMESVAPTSTRGRSSQP